MSEVSFLRHSAFIGSEDFSLPIHIVGCGAVGSNLALALAKMGAHNFVLWDVDCVEEHNLPNQAYLPRHIGMAKTAALADVLKEFNPRIEIQINNYFYESAYADELKGILVIATDSMKSRKMLGEAFDSNLNIRRVYEIRLGFDYGELHVVTPLDDENCYKWQSSLKDDSEIPDGPCNLRICTTLVSVAANTAAHAICADFSAAREQTPFVYPYKTMFSMAPSLTIYHQP